MRRPTSFATAASLLLASCALRCSNAGTPPPDAGDPGQGACTFVEDGVGPAGTVPVRAELVAEGLEVPWGLAFLPGGDVLVTERPGRVRLLRGGTTLAPAPVATLDVSGRGESGLLGIALHPAFATNRLFFLYLTADAPGGGEENRIERWRLSEDHTEAAQDRVVLAGIPSAAFHDGGRLRLGPDGLLYAGTGDAGRPDLSQDPASVAGKLLRLTPEGAVPADNPDPSNPAYLSGIRNLQAFDWFDARTLVVADHGPSGELGRSGADEVSVARPGENLGWPTIYRCETAAGLVTPSIAWKQSVPPGGAALYSGAAVPEWQGSVLVGALGSKHLHRLVVDPATRAVTLSEAYFQGDPPTGLGRLRDVVQGPDGALWVTTSNCDGRGVCPATKDRIVRIVK